MSALFPLLQIILEGFDREGLGLERSHRSSSRFYPAIITMIGVIFGFSD